MPASELKERSSWKEVPISSIGTVVGGGTPPTSHSEYYDGDIAWITPKDLSGVHERYISRGERNITQLGYDNSSARMLPAGTVLFSSRAPIGYVAIAKNELCTNQGFKSVVPKPGVCDTNFLYYLLTYYKNDIEAIASGTTFMEVSGTALKNFVVRIPDLPTQEKIATILSSLDDKIEVNYQINRNLEEQAKAIFKSWFVDFEPFGGEQPDDWKDGTIADLGRVTGGGTPSKAKEEYYSQNGIPWITPKDLSINKSKFISRGQIDISDAGLSNSSAVIMPKGTVLFSSRAPIGYIAIAKNEVTTNQGFKSVVPHPNVGTPFVYLFLKYNLEKIESVASGSTFKEVSGGVMRSIPALIPDNKSLSTFTEQCQPLFQKQENLEEENNVLQATRDTLLPKLMSGEIDLSFCNKEQNK